MASIVDRLELVRYSGFAQMGQWLQDFCDEANMAEILRACQRLSLEFAAQHRYVSRPIIVIKPVTSKLWGQLYQLEISTENPEHQMRDIGNVMLIDNGISLCLLDTHCVSVWRTSVHLRAALKTPARRVFVEALGKTLRQELEYVLEDCDRICRRDGEGRYSFELRLSEAGITVVARRDDGCKLKFSLFY